MTAAATDATEFLQSVAGWLVTLSHRYARRLNLDADDVFQATACEIARLLPRHYDPERSAATTFTALAARQVAHTMAERERRHRRAVRLDTPGDDDRPLDVPGREPDPLDAAAAGDAFARLRRGLALLPDADVRVLTLRFGLAGGEPMKFAEIAAVLGTTRDRAGTLAGRAVDRLRGVMTEMVMTDVRGAVIEENPMTDVRPGDPSRRS